MQPPTLAAILCIVVLVLTGCNVISADAVEALITRPPQALQKAAENADPPDSLCVMSYNIKNLHAPPPNDWPARLPKMTTVIEKHDPAIVGLQEAFYTQVKDLLGAMPAYDWIGLGRDGGSRGEFMAVLYKKDTLEPVEFGHFWLSDTPNVIASATWGHSNRRMVTWVLFKEKASGKIFYLLNTHFDHRVRDARRKAALLIRKNVMLLPETVPLILMGDFNAIAEGSDPYTILTEETGLTDAWLAADKRTGEGLNTFNGFRAGKHEGDRRIDWILHRGPITAESASTDDYNEDGLYPSDHFPVTACFTWKE
ncbi:MAG: endonuclease/exonuclease/phosphatase family protein [Candidatus Hydrogenedentota bacterium]